MGTAVMAFSVGRKFDKNKSGFSMVGAHTDSPCLRVKQVSNRKSEGMTDIVNFSYTILKYCMFVKF